MNKRIKTWLFIAIASFLGWVGISRIGAITQGYSGQQEALAQAQNLVTTSNINRLDLDSLRINDAKVKQIIATLEKIPNLPGLPYQEAQKKLAQLRLFSIELESKLKIEEPASANLAEALKLDQEAAALVKGQYYRSESWQEAKDKWEKAINLLNQIPANTNVSDVVKKGLAACQRNYSDVAKVIAEEEKSFQNLKSAIEIAQKAAQLTANSPYTLPDLINAKLQWQLAISLLSNLSPGSIAATKAESQIVEYRKNYRNISDAIDQIEKCKKNNLSFESSCTDSIALNITAPSNEILADNDNQESTTEESDVASSNYPSSDDEPYSYPSSYSGFRSRSVYVGSYTRRDGTRVSGHYRSSPGTRVSGFGSFRSGGSSS
ncbi:hypothetical protein Ava_B0292 (plasmid) [Trichormus variabilis ATCC 29413]|uniref:Uncharacterized protein n=2 Tax=Anabaena variabilis TaxID=264691 RepID=Q3M1Y3_TRIV2|nr:MULTISPECIES: hypothetical protein [Nostocaceae]ABA25003.1 hypothetical protein Ava_B0292 [Trichormus variabilis ATCC 29413]MBC1217771.1 hypothetical protein [Trichormus variabilis ARAD]MBC1259273.1 hypothetical protein [Trichormus variabilis V5]MBC1270710.1 hypothetical protein [Trichormus variabilis FSR]MBC1305559.1 hypothetical protein [Trichormus variabilis N2B]